MQLKEPEEYIPALERLRERLPYAKNWKLRIEKHTNRHRETGGGYWGWYEVHPLQDHVAYWGTGRDDLKGVDLEEWNRRAEIISMANAEVRDGGGKGVTSRETLPAVRWTVLLDFFAGQMQSVPAQTQKEKPKPRKNKQ